MKALIMHEETQGADRKALIFLSLGTGCVQVSVLYDRMRVWFGDATFYTAWAKDLPACDCLSEIELPDDLGADLLANYWNGPDHVREDHKKVLWELVLAHRAQVAAISPGQMTPTEIGVKQTLRHLMA